METCGLQPGRDLHQPSEEQQCAMMLLGQESRTSRSPWSFTRVHLRLLAIFLGIAFLGLGISQLGGFSDSSTAASIALAAFGGDKVIVLKNKLGVEAHILTLGAVVQKLVVPDKDGDLGDIVLGFDSLDPYQDGTSPYFGATVGRVANRIAGATFFLDGVQYNLSANDPPNSLHGGTWGWSRKTWAILKREVFDDGGSSVQLGYTSVNGEEGYPGTVTAAVTFSLIDTATLRIDFEAVTDAATPINMAQHTYFNLDGVEEEHTILQHTIQINSTYVTPVDNTRIPTGKFEPVAGTAFDFGQRQQIGGRIHEVPGPPPPGYDVNFVLWGRDEAAALMHTKGCVALSEPEIAARVHSSASGRSLEVITNSPGLQFYSGNQLDGSIQGKNGVAYPQYGGFALETQMFPNFVNEPRFPQCILRPGEKYSITDIWRFTVE